MLLAAFGFLCFGFYFCSPYASIPRSPGGQSPTPSPDLSQQNVASEDEQVEPVSEVEWRNSPQIRDIKFTNQRVWLITERANSLFQISDKGVIRDPYSALGIRMVLAIDFLNESEGWLVDSIGNVWRTKDGGNTWDKTFRSNSGNENAAFTSAHRIKFVDSQIGWIQENYKILYTKDGGFSWTKVRGITYQPLHMLILNQTSCWVITRRTKGESEDFWINRTADGGKTWNVTNLPKDARSGSLFFLDEKNGWIGGADGTLYRTQDGGSTWNRSFRQLKGVVINSVFWSTINEGWLAGYSPKDRTDPPKDGKSAALHTTDGGRNWNYVHLESADPFFSKIWFENEQKGWLVGRDTIFETADGGNRWSKVFSVPSRGRSTTGRSLK